MLSFPGALTWRCRSCCGDERPCPMAMRIVCLVAIVSAGRACAHSRPARRRRHVPDHRPLAVSRGRGSCESDGCWRRLQRCVGASAEALGNPPAEAVRLAGPIKLGMARMDREDSCSSEVSMRIYQLRPERSSAAQHRPSLADIGHVLVAAGPNLADILPTSVQVAPVMVESPARRPGTVGANRASASGRQRGWLRLRPNTCPRSGHGRACLFAPSGVGARRGVVSPISTNVGNTRAKNASIRPKCGNLTAARRRKNKHLF